ncbi:hypothetical protein BCR44DRAFT_158769 [Catenaria anguillulae PL171]|uniref:FAD/NAD(P)-binding domain-containing protein n=1 Tax=Catenaria anguillulae PL171 TaxID=765915 RepID=A0A1Y2H448_9FUNG|nr:hypothetical protein BCR44DRAFT_158769 [Catenaria anguillulae PL171]
MPAASQPTSSTTKRVRIAIIGAGPAGIITFNLLSTSLAKSKTPADIFLVNDKDSTFNNVASPRALVDPANVPVEKLQYPLAQLVEKPTGGSVNLFIVVGKVELVNKAAKELVFADDTPNGVKWIPEPPKDASQPNSTTKVAYDYLVIALGSSYHAPIKPVVGGTTEAFADQFAQTAKALKDPSIKHVVVAGLGIVGIEIAGEIKTEYPDKQVVAIGPALLSGSPPEIIAQARSVLAKKNISVIENCTIDIAAASKDLVFPIFQPGVKIPLTTRDKSLSGTNSVTTDCVILATGIKPNSSPLSEFPLTDKGYVPVDATFQVKDSPGVFAVGDIIQFPTPGVGKLAYLAGEQAKVVAENLAAVVVASVSGSAAAPKLRSWSAPKLVIISSLGRDAGIGYLPGIKTKLGIGAFMAKKLKGGDGGVGLVRHIKQSRFVPASK